MDAPDAGAHQALDPVFRQYLETTDIPVLELRDRDGALEARWVNAVDGFDMPVDVQVGDACRRIEPTTRWTGTGIEADPADVAVDRDYYVFVRRPDASAPRPAAGVCEVSQR